MTDGDQRFACEWRPRLKSAGAILKEQFRELVWVVDRILPEGAYILASRPKVGKSWLALQLSIAVATGGEMFGRCAKKGRVIYLALEDNPRRIQTRLKKLLHDKLLDPADLDVLHFETTWSRGTNAAADLAEILGQHQDIRLIVVDTLERVRERGPATGNQYSDDYGAIAPFKALSDKFGTTILIVHHVRKGEAEDPLDQVSGTLGLTGSADGVLVLTRPRGEPRGELHLIGRDIEQEGAYVVDFDKDTCRWSMVGESHEVADTEQQQAVLNAIKGLQPIQPKDIAEEIGRNAATVRRFLQKLRKSGRIEKTAKGYVIANSSLIDERHEHDERGEQ
ncbi:MAG: AAA family ATPase [Planctomycetales bacterium]|nr:AAA family ATPase [Planctomycetales bacterium]